MAEVFAVENLSEALLRDRRLWEILEDTFIFGHMD
jgi:hypothetical protein